MSNPRSKGALNSNTSLGLIECQKAWDSSQPQQFTGAWILSSSHGHSLTLASASHRHEAILYLGKWQWFFWTCWTSRGNQSRRWVRRCTSGLASSSTILVLCNETTGDGDGRREDKWQCDSAAFFSPAIGFTRPRQGADGRCHGGRAARIRRPSWELGSSTFLVRQAVGQQGLVGQFYLWAKV
jgi:hypothetical protein